MLPTNRGIKTFNAKRIVHYRLDKEHRISIGRPALIYPIDHSSPYVTNTKAVITSTVIVVRPDGEFETMNTIYRPMHGHYVGVEK